jgi:hypothetical protein
VNILEIHQRLERLYARLRAVEDSMRLLVESYRRDFRYDQLCLYVKEDPETRQIYGPYWASLRKIRIGGERKTVKNYLGTRLTRKIMAKYGMVNYRSVLREYDRAAKGLRKAHQEQARKLGRIRRALGSIPLEPDTRGNESAT